MTGSSGYVGNYLLKKIAIENENIECIGMSRSGKVRNKEYETHMMENVRYVKGNCLEVDTFFDLL